MRALGNALPFTFMLTGLVFMIIGATAWRKETRPPAGRTITKIYDIKTNTLLYEGNNAEPATYDAYIFRDANDKKKELREEVDWIPAKRPEGDND